MVGWRGELNRSEATAYHFLLGQQEQNATTALLELVCPEGRGDPRAENAVPPLPYEVHTSTSNIFVQHGYTVRCPSFVYSYSYSCRRNGVLYFVQCESLLCSHQSLIHSPPSSSPARRSSDHSPQGVRKGMNESPLAAAFVVQASKYKARSRVQ